MDTLAVGIGGVSEWDNFEWLRLADLPSLPDLPDDAGPLAEPMRLWAMEHLRWDPSGGLRVLLVDLDNIRAEGVRLSARLALLATLASDADHTVLAGQARSVERSRPWLGDMRHTTWAVAEGHNEADYFLLDAAEGWGREGLEQFIVASNDGIFASLAQRGTLTMLSPRYQDLAGRLRDAATRVVDLAEVEDSLAGPGSSAGVARRQAQRAAYAAGTHRAAAGRGSSRHRGRARRPRPN